MKSWANRSLIIFFVAWSVISLSSCIAFQHKKMGYKSVEKLNEKLDNITEPDKISTMSQKAVEGALSGSQTPESEESIQKLTQTITKNLEQELNKVFSKIDTRTPGQNFSKGIVESLINDEVETSLKEFITTTAKSTDENFSDAILSLENTLSASLKRVAASLDTELSSLDESLVNVLSQNLQDSLNNFLNNSIANINLQPLSKKISTELLSPELRDSIISLATAVQNNIDITEPLPGIVVLVRQNAILLAWLGFFLIASLIYWSYFLRKRSILGNDLTEILHNLNESEDRELTLKLENFLKEKGHYEFYKDQVKRLKKKSNRKL